MDIKRWSYTQPILQKIIRKINISLLLKEIFVQDYNYVNKSHLESLYNLFNTAKTTQDLPQDLLYGQSSGGWR